MLTWRDMSKSIKLLEMISTQDSSRYCIVMYDGNGNITDYLDAAGTNVAHYEYGPFGEITASSGTKKDDCTHRFSTKPYDEDTGLIRYELRDYSAELGGWLSRDPIEEDGGVNLYGFVGNNGVGGLDRLGAVEVYFDPDPVKDAPFTIVDWHAELVRWRHGERDTRPSFWAANVKWVHLEVICTCSCPEDDTRYRMFCDVNAWATIQVNKSFLKDKRMPKIYGHEQKHIEALQWSVEEKMVPLIEAREKWMYIDETKCDADAKEYSKEKTRTLLNYALEQSQHTQTDNPHTPRDGQLIDPIDNSYRPELGTPGDFDIESAFDGFEWGHDSW